MYVYINYNATYKCIQQHVHTSIKNFVTIATLLAIDMFSQLSGAHAQ